MLNKHKLFLLYKTNVLHLTSFDDKCIIFHQPVLQIRIRMDPEDLPGFRIIFPDPDPAKNEIADKQNCEFFTFCSPVLWIRIRIGSVFRSFLDPDLYSEYGSGSTHANIG